MSKLSGKVALVTGASKGIGAGIAEALAAQGAAVVVNYSASKGAADRLVERITSTGGQAVAVHADLTQEADTRALVDATVERFGQLDVLVNNSGVYGFSAIEEVTAAEYHRQFDLNVLGLLLVTKAAVPHLEAGASIINISSNITSLLLPQSAIYSATKGAVDAITGVLARELGPRGIRVNAINPGMVVTEGAKDVGVIGSDLETQVVAQTPLGRVGQPEDVGKVAVFLASDDSAWVSGDRLYASGGMR